jgi:hypothetical protein
MPRAIAPSCRQALRDYYSVNCSGKASYQKCQQWLFDEYGHKFAPSCISEILKGTHLDENITGHNSKRGTPSRWPGLEIALFAWQKQMERKTLAVAGDVIRATAAK